MFQDEEFSKACEELDHPDTKDWPFFTEKMGVHIFHQLNDKSGLYSFKVYGELPDIDPELITKVMTDLKYRKHWDKYAKELQVIKEGNNTGIYWRVNFPSPLSDRDYTFVREQRLIKYKGQPVYVTLSKAQAFSSFPPIKGLVRVSDYNQSLATTTNGKTGCKVFLRYYENPGGLIPTSVVNWAAKTGVPEFLKTIMNACKDYPEFLKKQ